MTPEAKDTRRRSPLLQIRDLNKSYGGVRALRDVSLDVMPGEIHGLCGENGAGKSTLIKVLTGVVRPDSGQLQLGDQALPSGDVRSSEAAGIAAMHQESTAFPDLNAVDNIFVGRELTRLGGCLLDRQAMRRATAGLLERLGERIDLSVPIGQLPLAQRQMVSMARAMSRQCRLLIMDEPTASLSARETEIMLTRVCQLREQGVSVLYVSHRLEELFQIADRVSVLRDGRHVDTRTIRELDRDQLVQLMVGREVDELAGRHPHDHPPGKISLQVTGLSRGSAFHNVTFSVRKGEIVGLAGLVGAGRSEVARSVFGIDPYDQGEVKVNDRPILRRSVRQSMRAGLAMVPEDRQHEGLVLPMTIGANLSLASLPRIKRCGLIRADRENELIHLQLKSLDIRTNTPAAAAHTLSGGNQQKVVLGKWLATEPCVLILDEPTRGVDVAAKAQVHRIVRQLAKGGLATLLISSDLPELVSVCDRILVMRAGSVVNEFDGRSVTQEELLDSALPDAT